MIIRCYIKVDIYNYLKAINHAKKIITIIRDYNYHYYSTKFLYF